VTFSWFYFFNFSNDARSHEHKTCRKDGDIPFAYVKAHMANRENVAVFAILEKYTDMKHVLGMTRNNGMAVTKLQAALFVGFRL
jgi:hypothetical protein